MIEHTWDTRYGSAVLENAGSDGRTKPLYLLWRGERIYVGTEIEQVLADEILRLSAELAEAQSIHEQAAADLARLRHRQGRLEGMREAMRAMIRNPGPVQMVVGNLIAVAERELEGGTNEQG